MLNLEEIDVQIDELLLDPNNPRFISGLEATAITPEDQLDKQSTQSEVLKRFQTKAKGDDPDFDVTNIKDLYDSMRRIGFVGIDRPVVRKVKGSSKYLVLEGNRRVATIKTLLAEYASNQGLTPTDRELIKQHLTSFQKLKVMLLETEGKSPEETAHEISVILGLRHHGSLLSWGPLPRAFNIYSEYLDAADDKTKFNDHDTQVEVASLLCIKQSKVKSALRTYIAYLQLSKLYPDIKDDFYSLIEAGINDANLNGSYVGSYFSSSKDTFQLDEDSAEKFNVVCQFSTRDSNTERTSDGKKKILPTPKHFAMLGKLVAEIHKANHPAVKGFAIALLARVENEDDMGTTLEHALSELTNFENRTKWAEAISKLLKKQEEELEISDYSGDGNDRGQKDDLKTTMAPLRAIMKL